MNYNIALSILNLKDNYTLEQLKRSYHLNALKYHPDKNTNISDDKFKNINIAYNYLYKYHNLKTNNYVFNLENNYNNDDILNIKYGELVYEFIKILCSSNKNQEQLDEFKYNCAEISLNLLEQLNIEILEDIYIYLTNYNNSDNIYFNINDKSLSIIKKKILEKFKDYTVYILTPNINDLLNSIIYKLDINHEIICVPVWHRELIYNNNIIKLKPKLDDNIEIIDGIIYYNYYNKFENVFKEEYITIECLNNIKIPVQKLYIKKYQSYISYNTGIPMININNIFDISNKHNIIINIYLS